MQEGPREVAKRRPRITLPSGFLSMAPADVLSPAVREYLKYHQRKRLKFAIEMGLAAKITIDKYGMIYLPEKEYFEEWRIGSAFIPPGVLTDLTKEQLEYLIGEKEKSIWWKQTVLAAKKILTEKIQNFADLAVSMKADLEAHGRSASIIDMMGGVLLDLDVRENRVVENRLLCPISKRHPGITITDARQALEEAIREEVQLSGAAAKREELEELVEIFFAILQAGILQAGHWVLAGKQFSLLRGRLRTALRDPDVVGELMDEEYTTRKVRLMARTYGSWECLAWT